MVPNARSRSVSLELHSELSASGWTLAHLASHNHCDCHRLAYRPALKVTKSLDCVVTGLVPSRSSSTPVRFPPFPWRGNVCACVLKTKARERESQSVSVKLSRNPSLMKSFLSPIESVYFVLPLFCIIYVHMGLFEREWAPAICDWDNKIHKWMNPV